jgi:hypothetical protein
MASMIVAIVIAAILALLLVGAMVWVAHEQKKNRELTETLQVLQIEGIPEFMAKARKVMIGEIAVDDQDDFLRSYTCTKEDYPTLSKVELDFEVIYAHADGDRIELWIVYERRYLDSTGKTLMYAIVSIYHPAIWTLEKRDGEWIVVKVLERP